MYEFLEELLCNIVDILIRTYYKKIVKEEKIPLVVFVEEVLKIFKSYFYTKRIIHRLKQRIYGIVYYSLYNLLDEDIKETCEIYLFEVTKDFIDDDDLEIFSDDKKINKDKWCVKLEKQFASWFKNKKMAEYFISKFVKQNMSNPHSTIVAINELTEWFEHEEERFNKKNKKVEAELKKKGIPIKFEETDLFLMNLSTQMTSVKLEEIKKYISSTKNKSVLG